MTDTESNLVHRALSIYYKSAVSEPIARPSSDSGMRHHKGRDYIVLVDKNVILAVYSVLPGAVLKKLKKYPRAFVNPK